MSTLAINAGSSSLKFGLFNDETYERLVTGEIDWASGNRQDAQLIMRPRNGTVVCSRVPMPDSAAAAACAVQAALGSTLRGPNGSPTHHSVGHRVVHGGAEFCASVLIDEGVKAAVARLSELAPLHNPPA